MDRKTKALAVGLGKRIRERRVKVGLTQLDVQQKSGLTQSYLSRLESGQIETCLRTLRIVSETLGITLSELFQGL
jgi:HTH-type transcriptional regulator/antitoxin HipB